MRALWYNERKSHIELYKIKVAEIKMLSSNE